MTDVPHGGLQENRRQTTDVVDSVDAGEALWTGISQAVVIVALTVAPL